MMISVLPTARPLPLQSWCECNTAFMKGIVLGGIGAALVIFLVAILLFYFFRLRKEPEVING